MAILLIGSTGNGKSTLGNFLIDPDPKKPEVFEVATDNKPFTQETKVFLGRRVLFAKQQSLNLLAFIWKKLTSIEE